MFLLFLTSTWLFSSGLLSVAGLFSGALSLLLFPVSRHFELVSLIFIFESNVSFLL